MSRIPFNRCVYAKRPKFFLVERSHGKVRETQESDQTKGSCHLGPRDSLCRTSGIKDSVTGQGTLKTGERLGVRVSLSTDQDSWP